MSTILTISKDTIVYGSHNSGKTVHADIEEVNELMKLAASRINLKGIVLHCETLIEIGHITGTTTGKKRLIYGPGDIEVHKDAVGWNSTKT